MKKHPKRLYKSLCSELSINPYAHVFGTEVIVTEDEFNRLGHSVFLYFKNHKTAVKDIGHGMFGSNNEELKRLAKLYIIKFGCKPEIDENKETI